MLIMSNLATTGFLVPSLQLPKKVLFVTVFLFCFVFETGSFYIDSACCPRTPHHVDQADLELTEIHLPLPPDIQSVCHLKTFYCVVFVFFSR